MVTGLLLASGLWAQMTVPATPKRMVTRSGNNMGGVSITSSDVAGDQKVRYTTHLVLSDARQWTSTDGKTLQAKLIAFEDIVVETPKGAAQPPAPTPPPTLTVIRAGKIRLVSNQKVFELALERLSRGDRDFVELVSTSRTKTAPPP